MAKANKPDLETVDLDGVEILAVGGPYHGKGSPPEGDFFTSEDLKAMAENATALYGELHPTVAVNPPKNKVGHIEQPAVGYLENQRIDKTGTRLLADVKLVPKALGKLIKAGAYRARSVDLSKVTSQEDGKTYDMVVTGLAWLGARLPAVRTLKDVAALYEDGAVEERLVLEFAAGDVVWDPAESVEAIRCDVREALNGPPPYTGNGPEFWVRDVAISGNVALVSNGYGDDADAWVVPFTRADDGTIAVAPRSEWTEAEQTWIATVKAMEEATPGKISRPADTRPKMADLVLTDEAQRSLAEALKLDGDVSAESLLTAAKAKAETPAPPTDDLAAVRAMAEAAQTKATETESKLADTERRHFIATSLGEGRFEPGQSETIERLFESNEGECRKLVAAMPKNEDLAREYGSDENTAEENEETRQLADDQQKQVVSSLTGIPLEEVS